MNVLPAPVPWLEAAIVIALGGALCLRLLHDPIRAWRLGVGLMGAVFVCALLACAGFYLGDANESVAGGGWAVPLFGRQLFGIDELNAPLLPVVALVHFLTALATGRTKMRRFSLSWSLVSVAIRLAIFGSLDPMALVGLLIVGVVPPYIELRNRGKPTQVYVVHMALFVGLLVLGWALVDPAGGHQAQTAWATVPLMAAILIRCGTLPAHCWITDWFEHSSFGNGLLYVIPLTGVYAAIRLVLPVAPDWVLHGIGLISMATAVYAAGMAIVQKDTRRFFAYLFISHASLVLVGLELHSAISLTGALAMWIAVMLSLAGFGLTLRALEARFGRLSLAEFHGLYGHSPALAVCFLMTGLACVGFPGTLGFVSAELLVKGAVEASPMLGLALILASAINGIAVVRAYFYLFNGARHASTISLAIGWRERFAVLTLTALILGGGLYPQPGVVSRHRAAMTIVGERERKTEQIKQAERAEQAEHDRLASKNRAER
jgi:NADH-quinone oxidoreductase subunit M